MLALAGAGIALTSLIHSTLAWYKPGVSTSWQIQYSGTYLDESVPATVYDIDGFNATTALVTDLHKRGHKVICYFSAGSYENYTPDISSFPASVLGKVLDGWPDEKWLDIRQLSVLQPIMTARAQLAQTKGCDGIDWDNVDGYVNDSGFTLSYADQIAYNTMLANLSHSLDMAVGLKNDLDQIEDLIGLFDFAVNESCQEYDECDSLLPFIQAGKPVWAISYAGLTKTSTCALPNSLGFEMLLKNLDLGAPVYACRGYSTTSASTSVTLSKTALPPGKSSTTSGGKSSTTKSSGMSTTSTGKTSTTKPSSTSTSTSRPTTTSTTSTSKGTRVSSPSVAACATIMGVLVCSHITSSSTKMVTSTTKRGGFANLAQTTSTSTTKRPGFAAIAKPTTTKR